MRERRLLDETVADYEQSLQLTRNRYASGVASRADVAQAETQLETTQAQAIDLGVQRAQLEHAIAVLLGRPASTFRLAGLAARGDAARRSRSGFPSELLERRPDVAAAERRVAAANAQIGVAEAAYYPTVTLSAAGGFESGERRRSGSRGRAASGRWARRVTETVFDGGLRGAQTDAGARGIRRDRRRLPADAC